MKIIITLLAAFIFASTVNAQNNVTLNKVKGAEFSIEKNANGAVISWSTANEASTSQFEIEISYDGQSFETIRTVAASENTKWNTNYEAKFKKSYLSVEKVYYRVKTVFVDGSFSTTNAITLQVNNGNEMTYASIH